MKRLISVIGLLALVIVASMLMFMAPGSDSPQPPPFPDKLKVRVQAPPQKAGEIIRYVTYPSKDSVIPEQVEIEYANGDKGFIFYRMDGTIAESTVYWPATAKDDSVPRQLKSESKLALDGKTIVSDRSFRKDGTRERVGERKTDGSYEISIYFENGTVLHKHQLVSKDGKALAEEIFYADGKAQSTTKLNADKRLEVTTFHQNGNKASRIVMANYYWDTIPAEYWREDGSLRMSVVYSTYNFEASFYRDDGTIRLKRTESFYGNSASAVVYDKSGRALYRQEWRVEKETLPDKSVKKTYLLRYVEELDKDGKVVRKVELRGDGKTPSTVFLPDPPGSYWSGTTKTFREDGTLEKTEVKDSSGKITSTTTHEAKEGIREQIDGDYLIAAPFEEPPVAPKRPPAPSNPYGYGFP